MSVSNGTSLLGTFLLVWLCLLASHTWAIDPSQITPGFGWALMENGKVFHGQITPHGQDVTIEQELMSIRRKAKEIRCIAPTLRGLYEYQASKTINWGTGEHFHMARWCLENEMLDEAGIHFQWLKARLPEEPKIRQLEIHLREKLQNDPVTRASFALPDQPSRNSRVQKAVDETPQEATADLSADLVVEYREFVVPILRSRCGQAGCHGLSSGQAFVVPPNKSQSPNSLSKSLNGAVAAINMESYRDSPLLRKAVQPHGVQNQPPIDIGRAGDPELLEKLVGWIQRVALQQQRAGYMPMASSPSQAFYPQATSPSERPMTPYTPPARAAGTMEGNQILSLEQAIRTLEQKERSTSSKDPFDPEQFNRQSQRTPR